MAVPTERSGGKDPSQWQNDVTAAALKANVSFFALAEAYQDELENTIFPARACEPGKLGTARKKVLSNLNTLPVLQFIWKESPFVSLAALEDAGIQRMAHGGPLTVHGLATLLHTGTSSIGAALKRVDKIVRAAQVYGLIETRALRPKMVEIAGTPLLHALMLRIYVGQVLKLPPKADGDEERDTV